LQEDVLKYIKKHNLLTEGDVCILALSGGADSTALAYIMHSIADVYSLKLKAIHINHGIRGDEADRDADFTAKLCERLNIKYDIIYVDVPSYASLNKLSVEEAARILRYKSLYEAALKFYFKDDTEKIKKFSDISDLYKTDVFNNRVKIAVAHNKDDNAETVIMQLIRGTGLKGLSGMKAAAGMIIRPLLCAERVQIEKYLKQEGRGFVTDSTNLSTDYTRNRIRHNIIPELKEINQSAIDNINKAAEIISDTFDYLDRKVYNIIDRHMLEEEERISIPIEVLKKQPHIITAHIIRLMIAGACHSLKDIASVHIDGIEALMDMQVGKSIDLPYNLRAERTYESLCIYRKDKHCNNKNIFIKMSDGIIRELSGGRMFEITVFDYIYGMEIPHSDVLKWFDADIIGSDYEVRYRKTGDFIRLEKVGRKTVKSYMADEKIPARDRGDIPLLVKGSEVVWIVGKRINERFKIHENTKKILQIRYIK
jgi:tRNA(ile)-lysidine synthetase